MSRSENTLQASRSLIGRWRHELPTPALLLDLAVVCENIQTMARHVLGPVRLRPHAKSHKCAEIAARQLKAGAIGVTTATVWEAAALAADVPDILIANQVVGAEKLRALAETARETRITVAVDDAENSQAISAAANSAKSEIGVLIEVDVGMGRCGVRTEEQARMLAEKVSRLPGLIFRGVMGYEGHCVMEIDRDVRAQRVQIAMQRLLAFKDTLASAGFTSEIVSAGGTGTFNFTAAQSGVTEIQAGSYVFTDAMRRQIVPEFRSGLTVLATVISRHESRLVIDAGKKTVGVDFTLPQIVGEAATVKATAEEHMICETTRDCPLRVGDRVEVIPSYCPVTVNLHDAYHVVENGVVVDVWPILARGAGFGEIGK